MEIIDTLLTENHISAIYWLNSSDDVLTISRVAEEYSFHFMFLDGKKITTGKDFLVQVGEAVECPYMMGDNWNEVIDCMRDFEWFSNDGKEGYILFYDDTQNFALNEPKLFAESIDTFQFVIDCWNNDRKDMTLFILLRGGVNSLSLPDVVFSAK